MDTLGGNLCFRALDHKHERSDPKILWHLASHIEHGVLSRRERFGEIWGRILSGMFRQPQSEIYVASPKDYFQKNNTTHASLKDFLDWFDREHESAHRVYLEIFAPQHIDSYKWRQHIIRDTTPLSERKISSVVIRSKLIKESTLAQIETIVANKLPLIFI